MLRASGAALQRKKAQAKRSEALVVGPSEGFKSEKGDATPPKTCFGRFTRIDIAHGVQVVDRNEEKPKMIIEEVDI
jgi:hypothetical protein